jgi:hypothetical protein
MKYLLATLFVLTSTDIAAAQSNGKDFTSLIDVGAGEGGRIATSIRAAEVKNKKGYSPGAQTYLVFWVEAVRPEAGPTQVFLVGERLRWVVPDEAPPQKEYGPSDPSDPVSVGSPWRDADIRYRGSRVECVQSQYWCARTWGIEIVLPDEVVRSVVSNPKKKDIPLAMSKPRRVDWRVPREELIATLDALGVLSEFSGAPQ